MARTPRWKETDEDYAIWKVRLSSWKYFYDYIRQEMLDYRSFIWRGQRSSDWLLKSTLDRAIGTYSDRRRQQITSQHLENFKYAARGRRGPNPPPMDSENDWWALGQHHGLATPLLDWTTSPFAAAYFAFQKAKKPQTQWRTVFALWRLSVDEKSDAIAKAHSGDGRPPIVEFIRPMSDENARLVNQGGLFTRSPSDTDIEEWVKSNFEAKHKSIVLLKIEIPNKDQVLCLRSLNRMNINHLTLFPDLFGTSEFANMDLLIDEY